MPNKMTDNEIIKALESYIKDISCAKCGFEDKYLLTVLKSILDLINRQKADYDKLYKSYLKNQEIFAEQSLENERLKAEIERLTIECESQSTLWSKHFESIFESAKETIKAEAYKEFAKKVYDKRHRTVEGECVICEDDFFKAFEELGGKVSDVIDYY